MNLDHFAVISDIHGNLLALQAVLQDIQRRQLDTIFNLGDHFYGSLEPAAVAAILIASDIVCISGNQDRIIPTPTPAVVDTDDQRFMLAQLTAAQVQWIKDLPPTRQIGDIFLCHGTPQSDETYLLETLAPTGVVSLATDDSIRAALAGVTASLILCGHSHVYRTVQLSDGRLVVNPGSVGIPAYDDDVPYVHIMEAGSPHARYAILQRTQNSWQVQHIALTYDWRSAAQQARQRGRPDRARWIETGRA